jgi:hypothetical protein
MSEWRILEPLFQLIKNHIEELLGVLLYGHINRITVNILKGKAEIVGVELLSFGEFEIGEHILELMQHVIVDLFEAALDEVRRLPVISHQQQVSEWTGHVELLDHGDHVADAAKVTNPCVPQFGAHLVV